MPETAPTKADLLAAIAIEHRYWDALVATVAQAGLMDRAGANNGPWTFKEVAAHLNRWRAWTLTRLEAASQGGDAPTEPWPAGWDESTQPGVDAINAWFFARGQDRPAADVLAETQAQFAAMRTLVAAIAADDLLTPGRFAWLGGMPLGPGLLGSSFGHMHIDHEPDIRAWLHRETGHEATLPPAPPRWGYEE